MTSTGLPLYVFDFAANCHRSTPEQPLDEPEVVIRARERLNQASARDRQGHDVTADETLASTSLPAEFLESKRMKSLTAQERLQLHCVGRVSVRLAGQHLPTTILSPSMVNRLAVILAWEIRTKQRPALKQDLFRSYIFSGPLGHFLDSETQLSEAQSFLSAVRSASLLLGRRKRVPESRNQEVLTFSHGPLHADIGIPYGLMTPAEQILLVKQAALLEDVETLTEDILHQGTEDGSHKKIIGHHLRIRECLMMSQTDLELQVKHAPSDCSEDEVS